MSGESNDAYDPQSTTPQGKDGVIPPTEPCPLPPPLPFGTADKSIPKHTITQILQAAKELDPAAC